MNTTEQWRRTIGSFAGGKNRKCKREKTERQKNKLDKWTDLSCRLFVLSIAMWVINIEYLVLSSVLHQPNVNLLLLSNDVESNPGRTIDEQFAMLHDNINEKFKSLKAEVDKIQVSLKQVQSEMAEVKGTVGELKTRMDNIEETQHDIQLDANTNSECVSALTNRIDELCEKIEKQERYSRRENVIFHGMKEERDESYTNMRKKVADFLNRNVKEKVWSEGDILRAHRLGDPNNGKSRPVIVRFVQFMDKLSVLRAREYLKRVDVGVSNDLTVNQRNELAKLREKGERGYYKNGTLHIEDGAQLAHAQMGAGATQSDDRYFAKAPRRGGRGGRGGSGGRGGRGRM